jgi:ABC-type multidrug transport system ATPase subunit
MNAIIEIAGLVKNYGSFRAVDGLTLNVQRGEVFGFLGPNGAGKSTTIRMMLSLIKPTEGMIRFFGMDLSTHRTEVLKRIGSIVEKPDFYKFLSARKNLELLARIAGKKIGSSKIDEVMELVGLKERQHDKVKAYSFGMKQRLGIAHALMGDPDLIILDEPATGLDPHGIIDIRNLIMHLAKDKGITVFLSSHILSEIEMIATSLAIINKGKTVVQGSLAELMDEERAVLRIKSADPRKTMHLLGDHFHVANASVNGDAVEFNGRSADIPAIIHLLSSNGIDISEVNKRTRLEDLFLRLTEN